MMYITFNDWAVRGQYGVSAKIMGQVHAFADAFGRVYFTGRKAGRVYLGCGEQMLEQQDIASLADYVDLLTGWLEKYHIEKTYIRYPLATHDFIRLLEHQKKSGIRSVLELPLYPYDKLLVDAPGVLLTDRKYRQEIPKYLDRIARVGGQEDVWGVKSIYIFNGIDMEKNCPPKHSRAKTEEIVFIVVSSMEPIHGYERLIEGLKNYYGDPHGTSRVRALLVGTGPEEARYKKMVQKYGLGEFVEFHGFQTGKKLEELYGRADIAVGALGGHKYQVSLWDTLKNAEYCLHGLPMVFSHVDLRFPPAAGFIFQAPPDDTPLDIGKILSFYNELRREDDFAARIQSYAREKLSWSSSLEPVIAYLKNENT